MKKILILSLLALALLPDSVQASEQKSANKTEIKENFGGGRRSKSGRYKKKKGFMWGLFRGKNQCDCPKH